MPERTERELTPEDLYRHTDPSTFSFESTAELDDSLRPIGQDRATEAVELSTTMKVEGYNLFVLGREGARRHEFVRQYLEGRAAEEPAAPDWCYVNNFEDPRKPKALRLPAGRGRELERDVDRLLEDAHTVIPAAFESDDYRTRQQAIEEEFKEEQERALEEVNKEAQERGVGIIQTPTGIAFAPLHGDEPLSPREFELLEESEQARLREAMEDLGQKFQAAMQQVPKRMRDAREKVRALDRETATWAVGSLFEDLEKKYEDCPTVVEHLEAMEADIVDNIALFRMSGEERSPLQQLLMSATPSRLPQESPASTRYTINVLVDHHPENGAPTVFEDHPTHARVFGDIEHVAQMGTLVTDFRFIKAGALHRASGGYLVLDARKMLFQPFVWDALKRALRSRELRIQSVGQELSLVSTVSLEPAPIPFSAKVILIGDRVLYYLLQALDPEFSSLFKVAADFEDDIERNAENTQLYGRLLATLARNENLRPMNPAALARVIEESARQSGDGEKLSAIVEPVADIVREADYWASRDGAKLIAVEHVEQAVSARIRRNSRIRDRLHEQILRDTVLIETDGAEVGQINGLSVIELGGFSFGRPSRITARVSMGGGKVIDIEREVELGGPIHSKGVLILSSYLASRYGGDRPLSLSASLVFEQSYGGVEGDSASCAELCALLSSLAEAPIAQSLAVTGSVNQHGQVQAIGGVNEKIEGFFDLCRARGLTGKQGVLIPSSNVKHLMLRADVRDAVREGRFHVYPIQSVDGCMEVLTGLPVGERDSEGNFPAGSINQRVMARLRDLADKRRAFAAVRKEGDVD
jgi:lon-related putative ATP-dependent protease